MSYSIEGLVFASDVEAAVVRLDDKEEIKTVIPPALLFHTKELPIIEEIYDEAHDPKVPHHVFHKTDNARWYQDSALVETDFSPSSSAEGLFKKFLASSEDLEMFLRPKGYLPWFAPVSKFDAELVKSVGDDAVFQASIAGCNPDLDACDGNYRSETISLEHWEYRGVGGHLHMSIGEKYGSFMHDHQAEIIRMLAITVGNMGVVVSRDRELEKLRKKVFGNPGRYRAKTYPNGRMGLEYRSLSASWLQSLETVERIIEAANFTLMVILEDITVAEDLIISFLERSIKAVQTMDIREASAILSALDLD